MNGSLTNSNANDSLIIIKGLVYTVDEFKLRIVCLQIRSEFIKRNGER